jgi:hypothetical protein
LQSYYLHWIICDAKHLFVGFLVLACIGIPRQNVWHTIDSKNVLNILSDFLVRECIALSKKQIYDSFDLLLTRLSIICAFWIETPENDETHTTFIFGFRLWKINLKILSFIKFLLCGILVRTLNHGMDLTHEIRTYKALLPVLCKKRDALFLMMLRQLTRDCLRADCIPIPFSRQ